MKAVLCIGSSLFVAKSHTQAARILDALSELQPMGDRFLPSQKEGHGFGIFPTEAPFLMVKPESWYRWFDSQEACENFRQEALLAIENERAKDRGLA